MCEGILVLSLGGFAVWLFYQLTRPSRSAWWRAPSTYKPGDQPYESPLGLVDNPEDEWIEWAIMDELDGEG